MLLSGLRRPVAAFNVVQSTSAADARPDLTVVERGLIKSIMEGDPPPLPVVWERINEIWYNYVKGLNPAAHFGIFDVVHLDTVWLDKV